MGGGVWRGRGRGCKGRCHGGEGWWRRLGTGLRVGLGRRGRRAGGVWGVGCGELKSIITIGVVDRMEEVDNKLV